MPFQNDDLCPACLCGGNSIHIPARCNDKSGDIP
ncbi:hypothetical protein HNQ38_002149 [Desulfovibrio intestinalis]|uniref:Uncharacterized protein n=1 Tax=Desulfovibrio intestinalis TaxID=58621 RepID=A0A7W8C1V8_9BACT|nr:hypothetical protein [Desulfovibrio intestinalis]